MERQNPLINLSPYFPPQPAPLGWQTRRLARHGFLSNRWGLQRHRLPQLILMPTAGSISMSHGRNRLNSAAHRGLGAENRQEEIPPALDAKLRALQVGLQGVMDSIRQPEKTADTVSKQFTVDINRLVDVQPETGTWKRLGKIHEALDANGECLHRLEVESLERERRLDKERLKKMEMELHAANLQMEQLANDLAQAQLKKLTHREEADEIKKEAADPDKAIQAAFLSLRQSILDFTSSSALQLGQLPDASSPVDSLFHPRTWNCASVSQRRQRVMAAVFHLLFRRILRPGLRIFGLRAFLKSDEHSISASEAHLRSLEKELEAQGVDSTTLHAWIAATIDITASLRDIPKHIERFTQQIFEALQPVMRKLTFSRNTDKVKARISAICEEAVQLKLAMRAADGSYKIEAPSRDSKRWGEPGCDQETRALKPRLWLQVVDHEMEPDGDSRADGSGTHARETTGDIACIPFGALTKLKKGQDGGTEKVILEKGWVIARRGGRELKRKASVAAVEEGRPKKRIGSNHPVPLGQLARIKALMGGERRTAGTSTPNQES